MQHPSVTSPALEMSADLRLVPAHPRHLNLIIEAVEEPPRDIRDAMPWIDENIPIHSQMQGFLNDVLRGARLNDLHHWVILGERPPAGPGEDAHRE